MSVVLEMPRVTECTATNCAYNQDGCHAFAVSINADGGCAAFLQFDDKGGLDVVAQVGACQRADCVHNSELECHAPAVTVGAGADEADCLTYRPAAS